jgi:hypothetical protein
MNNHTHTHYTSVLRGNPKQKKTTKFFFLYVLKNYIHWKHQLPLFSRCNWKGASNHLVSQATTRGKLELPNSLATTRRSLQPPMFSDCKRKVATTTYPCPVQLLQGKNSLWPRVNHNRQVSLQKSTQLQHMLYKLMCNIIKRPTSIQHLMMFHH